MDIEKFLKEIPDNPYTYSDKNLMKFFEFIKLDDVRTVIQDPKITCFPNTIFFLPDVFLDHSQAILPKSISEIKMKKIKNWVKKLKEIFPRPFIQLAISNKIEEFEPTGGFLGRKVHNLISSPGLEIKNNLEISYEHSKIILTKYGYMLKDLNSSNGTYFRVKKALILEKDTVFEAGESRFKVEKITIKENEYKNKKKIVITVLEGKAKNGDKPQIILDFNKATKYKLGSAASEKPEYVTIADPTLERNHITIYYKEKNFYLQNTNKKEDLWLKLPDSKEKTNINSKDHLNVYLLLQKDVEIRLSGDYHITINDVSDSIQVFTELPSKGCKYCGTKIINYYAMMRNCQHILSCYQCRFKIDKCWICDCQIIEIDKVIVSPLI